MHVSYPNRQIAKLPLITKNISSLFFFQIAGIKNAISNRWRRTNRASNPKDFEFSCNDCGRVFARKWELAAHRTVHTTDRPYQCECGRRYKYKSNLYLHRKRSKHSIGAAKRRNGDKRGSSDIENSLDHKLSELFSMILTGQDNPDKEIDDKRFICKMSKGSRAGPPFRCTDCGKEFNLRRGLVKHRRLVHTLGQPIECGHCGKYFKHENSLRRHRRLFAIDSSLYVLIKVLFSYIYSIK